MGTLLVANEFRRRVSQTLQDLHTQMQPINRDIRARLDIDRDEISSIRGSLNGTIDSELEPYHRQFLQAYFGLP